MTIINPNSGILPEFAPVTSVLQDSSERLFNIASKMFEARHLINSVHESISQEKKWPRDDHDLRQSISIQLLINDIIWQGISLRCEVNTALDNSAAIDKQLATTFQSRHFSMECPEKDLIDRINMFVNFSTDLKQKSDTLLHKLNKINQSV